MSVWGWFLASAGAGLVMLGGLTACQPVRVLNALIPQNGHTVAKDLAYGEHPRQVLDVYYPAHSESQGAIIVFIYGGSWESGSKDDFLFVGEAFARLGYITVIPDYRLYPAVVFPDFIEDIAAAMAQLDSLVPTEGEVQRQFILAGHSAGAHTAAMLAADPRYLESHGIPGARLQAFVGLAGPYDLPLQHEQVVDKFSNVVGDEANPLALATRAFVPTLLLHGLADEVAVPQHSRKLAQKLQEMDVPVEAHFYERIGHAGLLASLASPLRFLSGAHGDIADFLQDLRTP